MIRISTAEGKIIDTPLFQRLRCIKQLGTSHLVHHGAEHANFGHNIGVMFLVVDQWMFWNKSNRKSHLKKNIKGYGN